MRWEKSNLCIWGPLTGATRYVCEQRLRAQPFQEATLIHHSCLWLAQNGSWHENVAPHSRVSLPQPFQQQSMNVEKLRGGVGWRFSLCGLNGSRQTVPIVWVFEIRSPFAAIFSDFNAHPDRKKKKKSSIQFISRIKQKWKPTQVSKSQLCQGLSGKAEEKLYLSRLLGSAPGGEYCTAR